MSTITVTLSETAASTLRKLAEFTGESVESMVAQAADRYARERFKEEVNASYARLRADPELWAQELAERAEWEVTLADGLEDDRWDEMPDDAMTADTGALQPDDVRRAAAGCVETLAPLAGEDWGRFAHGLEWTCRFTLEHTAMALDNYATHLATRAAGRQLPSPTRGPASLLSAPSAGPFGYYTVAQVLKLIEVRAAILAEVAWAAPPEARGWHPYGIADATGFVGMGCVEILVHTWDIARAFGADFQPPADLCRRVVARMFPWAPAEAEPWAALLWATGRLELPSPPTGLPARLGPDWGWLCAPLAEWDGRFRYG